MKWFFAIYETYKQWTSIMKDAEKWGKASIEHLTRSLSYLYQIKEKEGN